MQPSVNDSAPIRLLFVHTEQYTAWKDELFFNLIRRPMTGCGLALEVHDVVRNHRGPKDKIDFRGEGEELLNAVSGFGPDVIVYSHSWYDIPGECWERIRRFGIPVFSILWDTLVHPAMSEINIIRYSDYIAVCDSVSNFFRYRLFFDMFRDNRSRVLFGSGHHVVRDVFCRQEREKTYDVTLLGSGEGQRLDLIRYLERKVAEEGGIGFHKLGGLVNSALGSHEKGLTDGWMPLDQYVEVINRSKILLCSQTRPERIQVKGKIFEFLSCGGFCLIDRNFEYESLIPPGCVAYYDSMEDAWDKIRYYMAHPAERDRIAEKGYQWYAGHFDYRAHWSMFLRYVTGRSDEFPGIPTLEEAYGSLRARELGRLVSGVMDLAADVISGGTPASSAMLENTATLTLIKLLARRIAAFLRRQLGRLRFQAARSR